MSPLKQSGVDRLITRPKCDATRIVDEKERPTLSVVMGDNPEDEVRSRKHMG